MCLKRAETSQNKALNDQQWKMKCSRMDTGLYPRETEIQKLVVFAVPQGNRPLWKSSKT